MSRKLLLPVLVVALSLTSGGCAARLKGDNLGGGFSRVTKQVKEASEFEGISYFDHLYYHGADLGQVGYVSVAPSGRYAIFERSGDIFLIVSATGSLKSVTDGDFSIPRQVRWYESEGYAQVEYYDDHPISRIDLQ